MEYSIAANGTSREIQLSGDLSIADSKTVQGLVEALEKEDFTSCTVNLQDLTKIDSAGLSMLLMMNDAVQNLGRQVCLSNATGQVRKMLELSKFTQIMAIKP